MKGQLYCMINHLHGISALQWRLLLLLFLSPSFLHPAAAQHPDDNDYNLDSGDVNPSLAVTVIVLVLVFFIAGFISLCIHQCSDSSSTAARVAVHRGGVSRRGNVRGLEESVIETFPTFLYSEVKELKVGKGSLECAVCLNEFEEDETLRLLPKCDHVFHCECIDAWLAGHVTCPVCRADLVPAPIQIGNPAESTHQLGSVGEEELPSEEGTPSCDVRIAVADDNRGERKEDRKMNSKFPRSQSTGHSLIRAGEDSGRYTLKLPAEVRRQLLARTKLKRATSLVYLPRASSSRRGYRGGEGSGSSRFGGILGRSLSKVVSFRWPANARADRDVTESGRGSKRVLGTAVTPLESLPSLPV